MLFRSQRLGVKVGPARCKMSAAPHSSVMPWAIFLMLGAVLFRCLRPWVGGPENFAPLAALALCGGLYFPRPWNWAGPILALLISDAVLNLHLGVGIWTTSTAAAGGAYLLIAAAGAWIARRPSWTGWLAGSLAASVVFYLVTNTEAWWFLPGYEKNWVGWVRALTTGLPGYPPTWTFLGHSLISDLIFTLMLVAGVEWSSRRVVHRSAALRSILPLRPVR